MGLCGDGQVIILYPWVWLLLLPFYFLRRLFKNRSDALLFPRARLFEIAPRHAPIQEILLFSTLALLLLALSRPILPYGANTPEKSADSWVFLIDTSASMAHPQGEESRLEKAKALLETLLREHAKGSVSIVIFGEHAMTLVPLSRDIPSIITFLHTLKAKEAGKATALYDAIFEGISTLSSRSLEHPKLFLLSDGLENASTSSPEELLGALKSRSIPLYPLLLEPEDASLELERLARESGGALIHPQEPSSWAALLEILRPHPSQTSLTQGVELYIYPLFFSLLSLLGWLYWVYRPRLDSLWSKGVPWRF